MRKEKEGKEVGDGVTPRSEHGKRYLASYIVRTRETLPKSHLKRKVETVGFRESRREMARS